MSLRLKTILIYVLLAVIIIGVVIYFQYHQFHWWLLLIPVFSAPLKIIYFRRQKHLDDLQARRERSLSDAKAAEPSRPGPSRGA
jgi:hypothetical protein